MKGPTVLGFPAVLLVLVGFLAVSCGPVSYPLTVDRNHTVLLVRDSRQTPLRFIVDTGAVYSFLNKRWAVTVGAEVIPCADSQAPGINASVFWNSTCRGIPVPDGVPPVLEGLPLVEPGPGSLLAILADAGEPVAGILGLDVLEGWSLDYRDNPPRLVAGSVDGGRSRERPRYELYRNPAHWWVPCSLVPPEGGANVTALALIDSGSVLAAAWYHPASEPWPGEVTNPLSRWQLNGLAVGWFSTPNFQIGDFAPSPFTVTSVAWTDPGRELSLGTPFLVRHRAVVNLSDHTLIYDRKARVGEEEAGAESWAWSASVEPGTGIRMRAVVAGSVLDRRGVQAGDVIAVVDGEPAGRPRSVLEWNRAWQALSRGRFSL